MLLWCVLNLATPDLVRKLPLAKLNGFYMN